MGVPQACQTTTRNSLIDLRYPDWASVLLALLKRYPPSEEQSDGVRRFLEKVVIAAVRAEANEAEHHWLRSSLPARYMDATRLPLVEAGLDQVLEALQKTIKRRLGNRLPSPQDRQLFEKTFQLLFQRSTKRSEAITHAIKEEHSAYAEYSARISKNAPSRPQPSPLTYVTLSSRVNITASDFIFREHRQAQRLEISWSGSSKTVDQNADKKLGGRTIGGQLDLRNTAELRQMLLFIREARPKLFSVSDLPGNDDFEKVSLIEVLKNSGAIETR